MTSEAWILTADAMDYDEHDYTIGVFGSLPESQAALTDYIQDAIERHPSNLGLLKCSYTATLWAGTREIESWTKDGDAQWTRISLRGSDQ